MESENLARSTWKMFKSLEGSDFIATELALRVVSDWCMVNKPSQLIDIGAGIGTFSYLGSRFNWDLSIFAFEENSWCREQFQENLTASLEKVRLVSTLNELEEQISRKGGILIIDAKISRAETRRIIAIVRPEAVFIEGLRRRQCLDVALAIRAAKLNLIPRLYLGDASSSKGGTLFSLKPPNLISQLSRDFYLGVFFLLTIRAETLAKANLLLRGHFTSK